MIKEKGFSRGGCAISKISPERETVSSKTKALNIYITFEESLKFSLALQDRLLELNRYDRRRKEGAKTCVNLTFRLDANRLIVNKGNL